MAQAWKSSSVATASTPSSKSSLNCRSFIQKPIQPKSNKTSWAIWPYCKKNAPWISSHSHGVRELCSRFSHLARHTHMTSATPNPLALIAELTHRCPLHCVYCSNPLELTQRSTELSTEIWSRVFQEAAELG